MAARQRSRVTNRSDQRDPATSPAKPISESLEGIWTVSAEWGPRGPGLLVRTRQDSLKAFAPSWARAELDRWADDIVAGASLTQEWQTNVPSRGSTGTITRICPSILRKHPGRLARPNRSVR
jgi:hypothetical protein